MHTLYAAKNESIGHMVKGAVVKQKADPGCDEHIVGEKTGPNSVVWCMMLRSYRDPMKVLYLVISMCPT